ncbi:beta-defensin 121 isoform X2 [Equus przewalskii]|uniref:Beta-defensin n=1 Tax=Equus przewalskii TaxID=9798 RepID=A0ABM4LUH5_EQUPR
MKLLLVLTVTLLLARVTPVADCWMNGKCRLVCKDDEDSVTRCANRKRCCVLSRYLTIQPVTIDGELPWTTPVMTTYKSRSVNRRR